MKRRTSRSVCLRLALGMLLALSALVTSCSSPPQATPVPEATAAPAATVAPSQPAAAAAEPATAVPQEAATTIPESKKGGQITIGFSQETSGMNPIRPYIECGRAIHYAVFDSLWRMDENGTLMPNLALEIPSAENGGVSQDALVYTIKLRQDAKWHDGKPFTSRDVKFTYDAIMDPDNTVMTRSGYDRVVSVETPDDYTVKFTLKEPYAPFVTVTLLEMYFIPEHILGQVADLNTAEFNTSAPIGTGPFKFVEWVAGSHVTVEANPEYHGPGPNVDRLIFKFIPDLTMLFTQFKTGEVDIVGNQGILAQFYAEATGLPDRTVIKIDTTAFEHVALNLSRPVFQDQRVRQALYYGMDRQTILDKVYLGLNSPMESYVPLASPYSNQDLPKHEFNPEKARQLLDEAGWTEGSDGVRVKDGVRLSFENSTTAGNQLREETQQILQQQWKQIGVEMKINNMPGAVLFGDFMRLSQFDSMMLGIAASADPDFTLRFHSSQIPAEGGPGRNVYYYKNAEVDKLFEEGVEEVDPAKRKVIYDRLQSIMREDMPVLPLFENSRTLGAKKGITGFRPSGLGYIEIWNPHELGWTE